MDPVGTGKWCRIKNFRKRTRYCNFSLFETEFKVARKLTLVVLGSIVVEDPLKLLNRM